MSVSYYDNAVLHRIQSWVKDPNMRILKPEETNRLFRQRVDMNNDEPLTLPLIAISRVPGIEILNTQRQPKSYDGMKIRAYDKDGKEVRFASTFKLNAVPIQVEYQLDIYTFNLEDADAYAREFALKLINKPTIRIEIPYNGVKLVHDSTIHLVNKIEDNSDIPERRFPTQFTRFTVRFIIDDAYYFSVVNRDNLAVEGFDILLKDSEDDTEELDDTVEIQYDSTIEKIDAKFND